MKGFYEVNYCVYIKQKKNKFYKFAKQSIIDNNSQLRCHEPINNVRIYNIFFMLYPILKEIPKKEIVIQKAWDSWHPLNKDEKMPTNIYNKQQDDFSTRCYNNQK